jgi:hypothetical protein
MEEELTTREKKLIGMLQGYGTLTGSYIRREVFARQKDRCATSIKKLENLGIIQQTGVNIFRLKKPYIEEV